MKFILVVIYFFVEIYLIVEFANVFGIFTLFFEMIISVIIGFALLLNQTSMLPMAYNEIRSAGIGAFISRSIFRLVGALLLIIPGILCDVIGICFIVLSLLFTTRVPKCKKEKEDNDIIDVEIIEEK